MAKMPDQITFKYVCPEDLRDLYVNGLYGGVTPRKEIYIHFFSERHPLPKKATHKIDEQGNLGEQLGVEVGGDVVRMVQTSIVMDPATAVSLRDWLNEKINFVEINKDKGKDHES
jgi:hypothetical protein